MTATVSPAAREIAAKTSRAFDQDQQLAIKLNDAQHRLQTANGQLWSALHPDALGLLNDEIHHTAIGEGSSVTSDAIRFEHSVQQVESVLLPALAGDPLDGLHLAVVAFGERHPTRRPSVYDIAHYRRHGTWPATFRSR